MIVGQREKEENGHLLKPVKDICSCVSLLNPCSNSIKDYYCILQSFLTLTLSSFHADIDDLLGLFCISPYGPIKFTCERGET